MVRAGQGEAASGYGFGLNFAKILDATGTHRDADVCRGRAPGAGASCQAGGPDGLSRQEPSSICRGQAMRSE